MISEEKQTKKIWVGNENALFLREKAKEFDRLENCVYKLQQTPIGEFYLTKITDTFNFDYKIYGLETRLIERTKKTYEATNGNLGVLLNGIKGTGKTVSSKLIANALQQPTIIVPANYGKEGHSFLNSIPQNITLFIDEYEKIYEDDHSLLTIMDGAENSKYRRVFLMTTNRLNVNEYMLDRPTRVLYVQTFGNLSRQVILEILNDCVIHKHLIEKTAMFISSLNIITVDIVKAICREVNIHEESPFEFADIFNVKQLSGKYDIYMVFGEREELLKREVKISPRKEYWGDEDDEDGEELIGRSFYIDDRYVGEIIQRVDNDSIKVACALGNGQTMERLLGKRAADFCFATSPTTKIKRNRRSNNDEDDENENQNQTKEMVFRISNSFMVNSSFKKGAVEGDMIFW